MKTLLKLEYFAVLLASVYLFSKLNFAWWLYPACFLLPDLGMIGYVVNTRVGAFTYNLCHHFAVALLVYSAGIYFQNESLLFWGTILLGHSAFDRILGYGLKYGDDFKNTHLGRIGRTEY